MNLNKCFADDQLKIVGYTPSLASSPSIDCIFLYGVDKPSGCDDSLPAEALFPKWYGAAPPPGGSGLGQRAAFFSAGMPKEKAKLAALITPLFAAGRDDWWGHLYYWKGLPQRTPDAVFPSDNDGATFSIRNLLFMCKGVAGAFEALDDFQITWDPTWQRLNFVPKQKGAVTEVVYFDRLYPTASSGFFLRPLVPLDFVAGAIEVELSWSPPPNAFAPADLVGFHFQAEPAKTTAKTIKYNIWQGNLIDRVASGDVCRMALDPRDGVWQGHGTPGWNGKKQNSRLDFKDALLHSHFFDLRGRRLALQCQTDVSTARLTAIITQKLPSGMYRSHGELFEPHGEFEFIPLNQEVRLAKRKGKRALAPETQLGLIVGAAPTEYLQIPLLADGTGKITFDSNHPALFLKPPPGSVNPIGSDATYLGDEDGVFVTSWLNIDGAGGATSYFSQPNTAPMFTTERGSGSLARAGQAIGNTAGKIVPIFPWAGLPTSATSTRRTKARSPKLSTDVDTLRKFELSNLAPERLRLIYLQTMQAGPKPAGHAPRAALGTPAPSRTVTPQGLVADADSAGYSTLYFGNPNGFAGEFCVQFKPVSSAAETAVFQNIQAALRQNQLFLLIQSPSPAARNIIDVSGSIAIRKFTFTTQLDFASNKGKLPDPPEAPILLIKYFKDISLSDLVKDSMWSCGVDLAPQADPVKIDSFVTGLKDNALTNIWKDPNWQGVLMLKLPKADMPAILKALEPGMFLSNLQVSYCGLSALPVSSSTLTDPDSPRAVSAFALIKYTPPDPSSQNQPIGATPDTSIEVEPGGNQNPKPLRGYQFIVTAFSVNFLNSQISDFKAAVDVHFGYLFWDQLTNIQYTPPGESEAQDAGNTITLTGHYEARPNGDGTGTTDVFSLTLDDTYVAKFDKNSCLQDLTFTCGNISVVADDKDKKKLTVFAGLSATATFNEDKVNIKLPLFDIGANGITFENFGFQYIYYYDPSVKKFQFGFDAGKLSADIDIKPNDQAKSVLAALPLQLKKIHVAIGDLLDLSAMGFTAITGGCTPPTPDGRILFHFGLEFDLDLGFFGKLAGDLKQFKLPLLLGWGGGTAQGLVFGIQFQKYSTQIDIGIQQFVRLRADKLTLQPCYSNKQLSAVAIAAGGAKITILGKDFPDKGDLSFVLFVSVEKGRKMSWAVGYSGDAGDVVQYIGAGHRINLPVATDTVTTVNAFKGILPSAADPCALLDKVDPNNDGWLVALQMKIADFIGLWLALADGQGVYGVHLDLDFTILKGLSVDLFYRRVSDALGIFSGELGLPDILRTIEVGAASFRLPIIRIEIHTDGGYLVDFGFPWNNDFSRSCQLEIAIFVGSGGFYYGKTALAADNALILTESLDVYRKPSDQFLSNYNCLECGVAVRVGIGRSFTIGILNADASVTVFGGLEGAVGYPKSKGPFAPSAYYVKGYVGLMLDIHASVDFGIVKADAYIRAYAMVLIEIAKVAASYNGQDGFLTKPIRLAAVVGLEIGVNIVIGVGCVSITITLHFSATWEFDETIGSLHWEPPPSPALRSKARKALASSPQPFTWNENYSCWAGRQDLNIYVTVLPCMATGDDIGLQQQIWQSCVVGQMWIAADTNDTGLLGLAKFLAGWVLKPNYQSIAPSEKVYLSDVIQIRSEFKAREEKVRNGDATADLWGEQFETALQKVLLNQFNPKVAAINPAVPNGSPFASIPFWYGTTFGSTTSQRKPITTARVSGILHQNRYADAEALAMAGYARCAITALLASVQKIIDSASTPQPGVRGRRSGTRGRRAAPVAPPDKYKTWAEIWTAFSTPPQNAGGK